MFPVYMMMDPSRRQEQGRGARHCFGECEPQMTPQMWRFGGRRNPSQCRSPQSARGSDSFSPVMNLLQNLAGNYTTCSAEQRNNSEKKMTNESRSKSEEKPKKEDGQSKRPEEDCPFQPLFNDIFGNVMTSFDNCHKTEHPQTWRQEVDCRGFKSRHIKVKIDARLLLVKANKKENSEFGVCTSSMTKNVPLPKNIDNAKITCKLSANGSLLVEAPYLKKTKAATHELVRDLLSNILPGLEETMKNHFGNMENATEKSDEKVSGENGDKENDNVKADFDVTSADKDSVETSSVPNLDSQAKEEETCKMTYADSMDILQHVVPTRDPQSNGNTENERTDEGSGTFPEDKGQEQQTEAHNEADSVSISSEDSFVLLSELEKETDGHRKSTARPDDVTLVVKSEDGDDDDVDEEKEGEDKEKVKNTEDVNTDKLGQQGSDGNLKSSLVECEEADTDSNNNNQETESVQSQKEESHNHEDFLFRIEMPSYNPETIKVDFDENKGILILSASKQKGPGSITKNVHIPDGVDVNSLHCFFRDGALSVTAPYKKPTRNIPINI